jgi:NADH-quinone oxidoreductase subunit J
VTAADVLFYLLALLVVGSALIVAFSRNIVHSAFALLGTFMGVAGLYAYLAADFLAVIQMLVYAGGILVLILFAVMLTGQIADVRITNVSAGVASGTLLLLLVLVLLVTVALRTEWAVQPMEAASPTTGKIGDALLSQYVLPFEVASVVLIAALIGAVTLIRKEQL